MVDLLKVTLTNGIPTSGNGDVATINALMADGGLATVGNKTDLPATATDATATTGISIWKQISKSIQLLVTRWPTALGSGGGMKVDGSGTPLPISVSAVPAHDVTNGGLFAVQQASGKQSNTSFTTGTTSVVPGDIIGVGGGAGALTFANIAPSAGGEIQLQSATLEIDRATISGEGNYRLYLYNVTPPSASADSAAWSLPAGDRASFLGFFDFGTRVDTGTMQWNAVDNLNKQIATLSGSVFGYLVALTGTFTATASVHKVTLHSKTV
jgi:hypothetical protein